MYIPAALGPLRRSVTEAPVVHPHVSGPCSAYFAILYRIAVNTFAFLSSFASGDHQALARRQFSSDPGKNQDIKIGLIVALTVSAFLAAVVAFLYVYGPSIRYSARKNRRARRRKSTSSKNSYHSDTIVPPPAPRKGPPPPCPPGNPPLKDPPPKD